MILNYNFIYHFIYIDIMTLQRIKTLQAPTQRLIYYEPLQELITEKK